jgi:hypothetical protein
MTYSSAIGFHNARKLWEVADKLSPFVVSLLKEEPRVRLHALADDVDEDKFFFLTKEHIHIPYGFPAVEHEIAHAVEMTNEKRWLLPDWGLGFGNKWEKKMTASRMFASMSREIRVRAIQLHMMPEELERRHGTLINILNNEHAWGAWAKEFTPYGRFKNAQDVRAWADDLRDKTYRAWSLDRIRHEWTFRLAHMQNWMETKEAA